MVLEGTWHTTRGESYISVQLQTLQSTTVPHLQDTLVQYWHKSYWSNQPLSGFKAQFMWWIPCPTW